jgi:membrane fusion protein, heavy metal efflux system
MVRLAAAVVVTSAVLVYLLWSSYVSPRPVPAERPVPSEAVQVTGPGLLRIKADTPLHQRLQVAAAESARISSPVLKVTGTVAASLRPGDGKKSDYWQFALPEVLTAYTDWQKAIADISFAEAQLVQVKKLDEAKVKAGTTAVERLKKLVAAGTDSQKDLDAAQADLLQTQIQGRKDIHEAETAVRIAQRNEAALSRQLQQAGLEPDLLKSATSDIDIVMADVPEGFQGRVKLGQSCEARFFGIPNQIFPGKVNGISPVISKDRRSLRVLFFIDDLKDQLRPGMFAEIGLGTDPREALLIPTDGVIHVGRADYVLAGTDEADLWRVVDVQVGEPHDAQIEVLSGLSVGDRVLGKGAILLKPMVIRALQEANPESRRPGGDR